MTKKVITLILVCLMLVSLAACGTPEKTPAASDNAPAETSKAPDATGNAAAKDTLNVAVPSDPGTLDPSAQGGSEFFGIIGCIVEPLYDIDENQEIQYLLAESIDEVSPTQWTVHLRKDVKFSNGNAFTADDVLFTIKTVSETFTSIRVQSIDIENTKKVDDYTIDLRFTGYNVQSRLCFTELFIYDAESYDAATFGIDPVGTGPYKLSEYITNSHVALEMRDDYWGAKPSIKNIDFKILAESSQVVNALETGLVDIGDVASSDVEYVDGMDNYDVVSYSDSMWSTISFNPLENSPFSNIEARYAVVHCIDKEAISNLVFNGSCEIMNGPVVKSAFDYNSKYDNAHETYTKGYDMDLAKKYAESSGLVGKDITIITDGTANYVTMAEILKNRLAEIGVNATIQNYDAATFITVLCGEPEYDIVLQSYFLPNMYACGCYCNGVMFTPAFNHPGSWEGSDRFFEICQNSIGATDEAERAAVTDEMVEILNNACLIYSICEITNTRAFSTSLEQPFVFRSGWSMRYQDFKFAQ